MSYWLGVIGTWILTDGIFSILLYTSGERKRNQSWARDHSIRILRCVLGVVLIYLGWSSYA